MANIPDNESPVVLVVGMLFTSEDDIRNYYREYTYEVGFKVTKRSSKKQNGLQFFALSCSRYGKYVSSSSNPQPTKTCNCQVKINDRVSHDDMYEIMNVVLNHNHDLSPGKSRHFQCNRNIDLHARTIRKINDAARIRMNKNYNSMVHEASGHEYMSFGKTKARTYIRNTRLKLQVGDVEVLQQYFQHVCKRRTTTSTTSWTSRNKVVFPTSSG